MNGRGADILIAFAAVCGGAAVALGAYGSHGLMAETEIKDIWETGVSYQMWHSLGAIAAALVAYHRDGRSRTIALVSGWAMITGALIFAAILYYFAIDGTIFLYGAAPTGGFMMMGGWAGLAVAALWRGRAS